MKKSPSSFFNGTTYSDFFFLITPMAEYTDKMNNDVHHELKQALKHYTVK